MARLVINSPDGKHGILEIKKPMLTLGRGSANDVVLNDTSVSRFHAVIKQLENDVVTIADRGSTNGVLVNGKRIVADTALNHNDLCKIGVYTLQFERVNDSALVVKKADIPSGLGEMLRGEGEQLSIRRPSKVDSSSNTDLVNMIRKLERDNFLLTVLYDCGKALNTKLSVDDIAHQVMDLSFRIEGVERGFMMLFDENGEVWRETEVRYRKEPAKGGTSQPQIILSQTILERIKKEQQPILITDVSEDERFNGSESMKISGLRSAMVAPLVGQRLFGILYVDNLQKKSAFTQEELNVFSLVAAQAAAAIDNASAHQKLAESAIQRSALERFLSPDVVEMIAANPQGVKLGGSNQKVTIMFADIRGFTSLSEKMPPEKIVELLNEYFTRVTDIIFDCGGTLDKYIGDAVMAVFGAPISKGNDAVNAVKAATEIQRFLVEMNRDAAARQWPEIKVGIGINTGIVTAGNIGSPKRIDYTVIGDSVNIASRLMSNAKPGQVIVSMDTAAELEAEFTMKPLPPLTVKGKSQPLEAFEIEWQPVANAAANGK